MRCNRLIGDEKLVHVEVHQPVDAGPVVVGVGGVDGLPDLVLGGTAAALAPPVGVAGDDVAPGVRLQRVAGRVVCRVEVDMDPVRARLEMPGGPVQDGAGLRLDGGDDAPARGQTIISFVAVRRTSG